MITLKEYLLDPCGSLSIPYWKWKAMELPESMKILHHREFASVEGYHDEMYFRLRHDLMQIGERNGDIEIRAITSKDWEDAVKIIRRCYPGISFGIEQLKAMTGTSVYAPELWLIARVDGNIAGCILADLDREAREGILEWVQVLPEYRRRGVGKSLVLEALARMDADFATVSGRVENATKPERLYRACGFTGQDLWHILRKA